MIVKRGGKKTGTALGLERGDHQQSELDKPSQIGSEQTDRTRYSEIIFGSWNSSAISARPNKFERPLPSSTATVLPTAQRAIAIQMHRVVRLQTAATTCCTASATIVMIQLLIRAPGAWYIHFFQKLAPKHEPPSPALWVLKTSARVLKNSNPRVAIWVSMSAKWATRGRGGG